MSMTEQFPATTSGQTPDRRGQGTMVEQARAASQVQAAVYLAREFPRNAATAKARMLEACAQIELAEAAFYAYERSGNSISGLTITAACELALIWGNVDFGLTELRRDDEYGQSEMLAYAWDMETNVRIASTFIVTHVRDTRKGSYRLKDGRDIYEKNTNEGNRRMRAAVLKVLPRWYVLAAERALQDTLKRSVSESGKPLPVQIRETGERLFRDYGLTAAQLEHKFSRPLAKWTTDDLVQLRILGDSLDRGEIRLEEAFPQAKVTADEIAAGSPAVADEPERGVVVNAKLLRRMEDELVAAQSSPEVGNILHRAIEHRDAGDLTQDEYVHLDVIASRRFDDLPDVSESDGGDV